MYSVPKFFKKLAHAAALENEIHKLLYHAFIKRVSTTLQKYNAKFLYHANLKIARLTGLMSDGD
jgi:hypothetical protein